MKLVFATHNPNKVKEIKPFLPEAVELVSLKEIGCHEEIAETATTIKGNAVLKAEYIKNNYGLDCFADDTGLEVEALHGEPGVYSARYAGPQRNDENNLKKLLHNLRDQPHRRAHFKTVFALAIGEQQKTFTGICKGEILPQKRGSDGFGYDPIFQPKGFKKSFAEMSSESKNEISHRGKALHQLINYLQENHFT